MTTTSTKPNPTTDLPDIAKQVREQFVSTVKQGQQLTIEAVQAWTKAVSVLPTADLPEVPGMPAAKDVEAVTTYSFDFAADLLAAQREFAMQLTAALAPAKSA
jgi:hypothetical protein